MSEIKAPNSLDGPWSIGPLLDDQGRLPVLLDNTSHFGFGWPVAWVSGITNEDRLIHARLIAAAPELLARVKQFRRETMNQRECLYEVCVNFDGSVEYGEDQLALAHYDKLIADLDALMQRIEGTHT